MVQQNLTPILLVLLAVLVVSCQPAGQQDGFTTEDKTEIVRLSLERALVDQEIPDFGLLVEGGNELVLSTENIEDVRVPDVPGFELILLSPEEIQARVNNEGDFLYLHFNPFEVETPDRVSVGFGSQWVVAEDSTTGYLSGGGLQMIYERQPEGWVGEVEAVWIS